MARILFVDDDPRLLSGIRRSLRHRRDDWEMHFAERGAEGIAQCDAIAPDVVVTELQMAGVDGEHVLTHVAERHPDTVRIVLSGMADRQRSLSTVHLAHQFLAKPCETEELEGRLQRVVGLRSLLDDEGLRSDLGGIDALPPAPSVYLKLQQVTARDDMSTDDVAAVIEQDPAMTLMVLKVVNSAFVGLPRTIDRVDRAVVLLGVRMVEDIVLAADAARSVSAARPELLEAFQNHSAATAMLAQRIAPTALLGSARTAGFLHDLGALFLAARRGPALQELGRQAAQQGVSLQDAVRHAWHVVPSDLGAYLLGMWGLPLHLVDAVAASAAPRFDALGLPEIVHIADALVHERIPTPTPFSTASELDAAGLERLGLSRNLQRWREQAEKICA
jgi:HD-like signal output (HDOD) protein/ActR/RegA family two-component response regulator